jgi:gamma-glutamyl hydrolase
VGSWLWRMLLRALLLLPAAVAAAAPATSASAPRIGLFPVSSDLQLLSYREWLTVMGAQTFVLPKSASEAEAERLFQSMDGMLLPGVPMSVLADETAVELERGPDSLASKLLDKALAANRAGTRFFPVWGTCLGFEWLTEFFGGNQAIAHGFDSVDWPQPLTFTPDSPGRMFGRMPPSLLHALANQNVSRRPRRPFAWLCLAVMTPGGRDVFSCCENALFLPSAQCSPIDHRSPMHVDTARADYIQSPQRRHHPSE